MDEPVKKIITLLAALAMVFSLTIANVGCSGTKDKDKKDTEKKDATDKKDTDKKDTDKKDTDKKDADKKP